MAKMRVGVLRGGRGHEYNVSLKSGAHVLKHLPREKYIPHDILITKDGQWHLDGAPIVPQRLPAVIDLAWNALHGEYGEDGKIQRQLEMFSIPHTGSPALSSAIAMNKMLSKTHFESANIRTPLGGVIRMNSDLTPQVAEIFSRISAPYIVKPLSSGSSVGVTYAGTFYDLHEAVAYTLEYAAAVLVEEYIRGREVTCTVIEGLDGEAYPLHPVEVILPSGATHYSYEYKYYNPVQLVCPANLSGEKDREARELAVRAHRALGLRHYSRSDMIVSPRGIYVLEVNSLPGLMEGSALYRSLHASGFDFGEFLDYTISLALE